MLGDPSIRYESPVQRRCISAMAFWDNARSTGTLRDPLGRTIARDQSPAAAFSSSVWAHSASATRRFCSITISSPDSSPEYCEAFAEASVSLFASVRPDSTSRQDAHFDAGIGSTGRSATEPFRACNISVPLLAAGGSSSATELGAGSRSSGGCEIASAPAGADSAGFSCSGANSPCPSADAVSCAGGLTAGVVAGAGCACASSRLL